MLGLQLVVPFWGPVGQLGGGASLGPGLEV